MTTIAAGHDEAALEFPVRGQPVAAILRTPRNRPAGGTGGVPGIVLTGPFTGVKEQVVSVYARRLADAGLATLVFDHRNFGASGGEPRQHEDSAGKLRTCAARPAPSPHSPPSTPAGSAASGSASAAVMPSGTARSTRASGPPRSSPRPSTTRA